MRRVTTALALILTPAAFGQIPRLINDVRDGNARALALHSEAVRTPGATNQELRGRALVALQQRKGALARLIAEDPSSALSLAFSPDLLADLESRFPGASAQVEQHGSWEGLAEVTILDSGDMTAHQTRIRLHQGATYVSVHFASAEPPGLRCGSRFRVEGIRLDDALAASSGSITAQSAAGAALPCGPTGQQNIIVLLATFPGVTPPSSVTVQSITDSFFGVSGRTVDGFWREASHGKTWATGQVKGWYTLSQQYACTDYYSVLSEAIAAADPEVNFLEYNRIFVVFPRVGACSWSGISNVGCGSYSTADGQVTASASWMLSEYSTTRDNTVKLAAHEGGHALGLRHSSSRDFGADALGPLNTAGTLSEYGDNFSTMGYWNFGHYTVSQKLSLGWLTGVNLPTVESPGTYTLEPTATSPAGIKGLKVRRGTGNNAWLWIEFKQPAGSYESVLGSQVFSGALIRYEDSTNGGKTHLLDYTTATSSFSDPALAAGSSWTDPYSNVKLNIQSAAAAGLSLNVEFGPVACYPAAPAITLSPSNPSVAQGASVSYTVSLSNKDSAGCANSTFNLTSSAPTGWSTAFAAPSLILAPGQTGSTTMTKTVAPSTTLGTYGVNVMATDASRSVTASASATVTAPPPPVTATLAIPKATYPKKSSVPISVTVLSGSSPAAGATVKFTLAQPGGAATTKSVMTSSSGVAIWNYKAMSVGTYFVSAVATLGSQSAATNTQSFTVY